MPGGNNATKKEQSTAPYETSEASSVLINQVNQTNTGISPSSQTTSPQALNSTFYNNIQQAMSQNGLFVSMTDKTIYEISYTNPKDNNPIKESESEIGNTYSLTSNISAEYKDSQVKKDGDPTISWEDPRNYEEGETEAPLESSNNASSSSFTWWGAKWVEKIEALKGNPEQNKDTRYPYLLIRESRTGTAAYTQISDKAYFSNDIVEIPVLQNVVNFDISSRQEIDQVSPRGSVTPMRFYNKNPGRTLSFTALFHQQEYPKEPLLSIEAKARYLTLPYKHSDYSVIPKLVEVFIPGRVYRGYLTSASATYSGDDYRYWSYEDIANKADLPSYIRGEGKDPNFYGGYQMMELEPRGGTANGKPWLTTEELYYGLSSLTISFSLEVVEEIVLTTFRSAQEMSAEAKKNEQEEQLSRKQYILEQTRIEVLEDMDPNDPLSVDDCIIVDENGWVIGVRYTNKEGNLVEKVPASVINIRYSDDNSVIPTENGYTYSEYKILNELKNQQQEPEATKYVAPIENIDPLLIGNGDGTSISKENMIEYLKSEEKKNHPEYTEAQWTAFENSLKNKPFNEVYAQFTDTFKSNNPSQDTSVLLNNSSYIVNNELKTYIDPKLKEMLSAKLDSLDAVKSFLQSYWFTKLYVYKYDSESWFNSGKLGKDGMKILEASLTALGDTWIEKNYGGSTEYKFARYGVSETSQKGLNTSSWDIKDIYKDILKANDWCYGFVRLNPNEKESLTKIEESKLVIDKDSLGNTLPKKDTTLVDFFVNSVGFLQSGIMLAVNNEISYYHNLYKDFTIIPIDPDKNKMKGKYLYWYIE